MVVAVLFCVATAQAEDDKIVGGTAATISQFPAAVQLRICGSLCAGSLITPTKVLTAAHCFGASADKSCITATVGQTESVAVSGVTTGKSYAAASFVTNPSYVSATQGSDVAVITLAQAVTLGSGTSAPQLARLAAFDGQSAVIGAGWGTTSYKGNVAPSLLQVNLNTARCYPNDFPATVMCTGTAAANGKDTCQGDSGGALWTRDASGGLVQIALVSYGPACGNYDSSNGKYTNLAAVLNWIAAQTGMTPAALTTPASASTSTCALGTPTLVPLTPTTWAATFTACGSAADTVTVALLDSGTQTAQATADVSGLFFGQLVSLLLRLPAAPPAGGNVTATFSARKAAATVPVSPAFPVVAQVAQTTSAVVSVAYPSSTRACLAGACVAGTGAVSTSACPSGAANAASPHTVACGCLACPSGAGGGAPVLAVTKSGTRQTMDAATCDAVYSKLACAVGLYSLAGYTCECRGVASYACPSVSCTYSSGGSGSPSSGGGGGGGGTPTYSPGTKASAYGLLGLLGLLILLPVIILVLCICCMCLRRRRSYRAPARSDNRPAFRECPPSPPPIVIPTPAPGPYDVVVGGAHASPWVDLPPAGALPPPPHQTGVAI